MTHRSAAAVLLVGFLLVGFVLGGESTARADFFAATLGQPLYEVSHDVEIRVADGVATCVVRRTFANPGTIHDEAYLELSLPPGAAVTGLRIRARDRWYAGELMEAEKARRMYEQLTGIGIADPKDPALLQWVWDDMMELRIFPVIPGATSTVEYTLTVPTDYRDGRYVLPYPRRASDSDGRPLALPVLRLVPGWGDATTGVWVDGKRVGVEAPVILEERTEEGDYSEWVDDTSAGVVVSSLVVDDVGAGKTATVHLDVRHTFRGDLRVKLVPPAGLPVTLHNTEGGGENDLRGDFAAKWKEKVTHAGTWRLVVSDHAGRDVGVIESWRISFPKKGAKEAAADGKGAKEPFWAARDLPRYIPDADTELNTGFARIEFEAPATYGVTGRLGHVVAASDKEFLRFELDVAKELTRLPKNLAVVFVIDGSHSIGSAGIAAQIAAVRAYLTHVPKAHVELVVYRRHGSRLVGSLVDVATFDARVAAALKDGTLAPGNGSALEVGLAEAAKALRGWTGTTRIVAFTDELLRDRFTNGVAHRALRDAPGSTITHLVSIVEGSEDSEPSLSRDDDHDLTPIARKTGGLFASLQDVPPSVSKGLVAATLELVRPIRVDHVRLPGPSEEMIDDIGIPETLEEGAGVRGMVMAPDLPKKLVLRGELWSRPWALHTAATADFSRATAAFVFSEGHYDALDPKEMMKVARFGRAVSPVTSYIAVEPGVRPSTAGIDRVGSGFGSGYGRGGGGMGMGVAGIRASVVIDFDGLVAPVIARCREAHAITGTFGSELSVETTYTEVVDVWMLPGAEHAHPGSARAAFATCVVEGVWGLTLSDVFAIHARKAWSVTL